MRDSRCASPWGIDERSDPHSLPCRNRHDGEAGAIQFPSTQPLRIRPCANCWVSASSLGLLLPTVLVDAACGSHV